MPQNIIEPQQFVQHQQYFLNAFMIFYQWDFHENTLRKAIFKMSTKIFHLKYLHKLHNEIV